MRLSPIIFIAACLLCGCVGDGTTGGSSEGYVYGDWLYYEQDWYDDDFWVWVDDHPECCDEQDEVKEALQDWYNGLAPEQQQAVRDRAQAWMDERGVVPVAGQSARDLVLESASQRWAALTPAERQQWLGQRRSRMDQRLAADSASRLRPDQRSAIDNSTARLNPEQRAALRESAQGTSFDPVSGRGVGSTYRSTSRHPTPSRAGLSGGMRFQAARGGGRGGRGGRGR